VIDACQRIAIRVIARTAGMRPALHRATKQHVWEIRMTSTTITSPEMLADCVREAHELAGELRSLVEHLQLNGNNKAPSQPLRLSEVLQKTATKKSAFYEMVRRGEFEKPYKIGRCSRWRQCDVDAFLQAHQRCIEAEEGNEVQP